MSGSVFIPEPIAAAGFDLLRGKVECIAPWANGKALSDEDARSVLQSCDAVIVRLFRIGEETPIIIVGDVMRSGGHMPKFGLYGNTCRMSHFHR